MSLRVSGCFLVPNRFFGNCAKEGEWQSLSTYVKEKAKPEELKKLKTLAQKRAWATKLGLKLQQAGWLLESFATNTFRGSRKDKLIYSSLVVIDWD